MRVVIDTNVFVSSFFGGKPKKVIDLWKDGKITLCLSGDILDEYIEVLIRLGMKDERELKELLILFSKGYNTVFTKNIPQINIVKNDPDDDKFIATAFALKARFIVTGDKHLLSLKEYRGIRIVGPDEFLRVSQRSGTMP